MEVKTLHAKPEVFFGGMIRQDVRGIESVVVNHSKGGTTDDYKLFIYLADSKEFIHLTGVGSVNNPFDRVYIGISSEAAHKMAQTASAYGSRKDLDILKTLDNTVVEPFFMNWQNSYPLAVS